MQEATVQRYQQQGTELQHPLQDASLFHATLSAAPQALKKSRLQYNSMARSLSAAAAGVQSAAWC